MTFQVVYFTALFPYFVLTIFFFRGITLHGASKGLAHMFTPKMDKLLLPTVWLDAANQVKLSWANFVRFFFLYFDATDDTDRPYERGHDDANQIKFCPVS